MTCVRIYFEIDNEKRRDDFCYFEGASLEAILSYWKHERQYLKDAKIIKVLRSSTWEEINNGI